MAGVFVWGIFLILNLLSLLIPKLVRHVEAELCWLQPSAHTTVASVPTWDYFLGAVLAKPCCCSPLLSFIKLVSSYVYKQNKKLHVQTLMLTSAYHPVCAMITEVNVGMAVRDNVSESKSLPPLQGLACPQPRAPITYLCCLWVPSTNQFNLLTAKRVWIVLC